MHLFKKGLFLACLVTMSSWGQQTTFTKQEDGELYHFNYQWQDFQSQPHNISFSLSKDVLFSQFRRFKTYRPEVAAQYVKKMIRDHYNKTPVAGVQVSFNNYDGTISIKGRDQSIIDKTQQDIMRLEQTFARRYLHDNYYHEFSTYRQENAIKPDHVRFAHEAVESLMPLRPIILEQFSVKNIREVSNFVLSFVQSIPYAPLTSRVSSSGAGFNPPMKLIWENQGDCDSKVTLTAAILRSLMPRIKMIMVFIDNHALIGIDASEAIINGADFTVNFQGKTYILAEPTGPAMLQLGAIDIDSEQAVLQGHYVAEVFK